MSVCKSIDVAIKTNQSVRNRYKVAVDIQDTLSRI